MNAWKNYFQENKNIDSLSFFVAGVYISHQLSIYEDAIRYLKFARRYYGKRLRLLFLSSGYAPFIKGVIHGVLSQNKIEKINYEILGSEIEFLNGSAYESFHINQKKKQLIVESILSKKANVKFLSDDSKDNMDLFSVVENAGGMTLLVNHIKDQKENKTWRNFCNLILDKEEMKKALKEGENIYSLKKESNDKLLLVKLLQKYSDPIGIVSIPLNAYKNALDDFMNRFKNKSSKSEFIEVMNKISLIGDEEVSLRSNIFYYWVPPSVFLDNRTIEESFMELLFLSTKGLEILVNENIFDFIDLLSESEKILVYAILDHLFQAILVYLNTIESASLELELLEEFDSDIDAIAQISSDLLYHYLSSQNLQLLAEEILKHISIAKLIAGFNKYSKFHKGMRELDNNISILNSVSSIIENHQAKDLDFIINYPYGGIAIGFAFKSYWKLYYNTSIPQLINCHFSSKKGLRKNDKNPNFENLNWLKDFIPNKYWHELENIQRGNKNLLLYDNNVTTLKTIELSKKYFEKFGNKVSSAVVSFNYENLCDYLLGEECEPVSDEWNKLLDFQPVEEYITAFNTWNTSQKSNLLKQKFTPRNRVLNFTHFQKERKKNFIFKLCRVHNLYDLNIAIKNGVNMIGIHAVYPNQLQYLINESKHKPFLKDIRLRDELPIALLEIDSIKAIQKLIPSEIDQAIVFEQEISPELMKECCDVYNMNRSKIFIQMHYRAKKIHIEKVKNIVNEKIIATVGLYQEDFD